MTDGIFIQNEAHRWERPASKKVIREVAASAPERIRVESTSAGFGFPTFDGLLTDLPQGVTVTFVGPDPRTSRRFYGTISRSAKGLVVK